MFTEDAQRDFRLCCGQIKNRLRLAITLHRIHWLSSDLYSHLVLSLKTTFSMSMHFMLCTNVTVPYTSSNLRAYIFVTSSNWGFFFCSWDCDSLLVASIGGFGIIWISRLYSSSVFKRLRVSHGLSIMAFKEGHVKQKWPSDLNMREVSKRQRKMTQKSKKDREELTEIWPWHDGYQWR